MGKKKKNKSKPSQTTQKQVQTQAKKCDEPSNKSVLQTANKLEKLKISDEKTEKRYVNLLHVYTIYKQRFRRLEKKDYKELLRLGCKGKREAIQLCKNFMIAKQIPEDIVEFEKNVGFLSFPRLMPLIALLSERADYNMLPSLVARLKTIESPKRFREKFANLLVYGFWFLGRVISDSLSEKEQVNRGNPFGFEKGDMGFWWAGVRILDWNFYAENVKDPKCCHTFVSMDHPKYRLHTNNAIMNMGKHPLYFLDEEDWKNYEQTVKRIKHAKVTDSYRDRTRPIITIDLDSMDFNYKSTESLYSSGSHSESSWDPYESSDDDLSISTMSSLNSMQSRESVD